MSDQQLDTTGVGAACSFHLLMPSGLFEPNPKYTTSESCWISVCACLITSSLWRIATWHPVIRCSVTTGPSDTSRPLCSNGPWWVWPYSRILGVLTVTLLSELSKTPCRIFIPDGFLQQLCICKIIIQSGSRACLMVWICCIALSCSGHHSQLAAFQVTQLKGGDIVLSVCFLPPKSKGAH